MSIWDLDGLARMGFSAGFIRISPIELIDEVLSIIEFAWISVVSYEVFVIVVLFNSKFESFS